jgi:hypothetical protein
MAIVGRCIVTDKDRYGVRPVLNGRLVTAIDVCGEFFVPVKNQCSRGTYDNAVSSTTLYRLIPTVEEFRTIEAHLDEIDSILRNCGGDTFRGRGFWTRRIETSNGFHYNYALFTMGGDLRILSTSSSFWYAVRHIFY